MTPGNRGVTKERLVGVAWGLFLGLAIVKFGNPLAIEAAIRPPESLSDWIEDPWPISWSRIAAAPILAGVLAAGLGRLKGARGGSYWRWAAPGAWLAWQALAALRTTSASLSAPALAHFAITACAWAAGWLVVGQSSVRPWLLGGVLAGFCFCLVRANDQKLFEFRSDRQTLIEGERTGWTNFTPQLLEKMRADHVLLRTNDVDIVNPVILIKMAKDRASGTLVYPNALAGAVLLIGPVAIAVAGLARRRLSPITGVACLALAIGLACGALWGSGSKSGWLLALAQAGVAGLALPVSRKARRRTLAIAAAVGLAAFGWRFHQYFAQGATSASARLDYWRAAGAAAVESPFTGVGPGAFWMAYQRLKPPEAEPARLAHNDYLEQFSDSGIPGGLAYGAWMAGLFALAWRAAQPAVEPVRRAIAIGVLGWFAQGFFEFGLYIPALGWTAFTFAGMLATDGESGGARLRNAIPLRSSPRLV